jgi:glutamine amidotransferase
MIGIIDYGMGNLRSVVKAFRHLGFSADIVKTPEEASKCDKLVLPGVGAFGDAISVLKESSMDGAIRGAAQAGKPFLGICLGMQLMFDVSHENGRHEGLKLLPGRIVRIKPADATVKIPHMGWNSLRILKRSPLFEGLPDEPFMYFDHAYHLNTFEDIVGAECDYGYPMQVAAQRGNLFALQFHPEKSGEMGLKILSNFGGLSI